MALDLKYYCQQLNSDKVTERKKASDKLKNLLNNSTVIGSLDSKAKDGFSWNHVFNSAKAYFLKEAKRLEDDERKKQAPSQTVLSNRENQKRLAITVIKLVLRKASLKVPHVSAKLVIDLILTALSRSHPYLLENYAGDFLQISIKYLFNYPQYYLEVKAEQYKGLLRICLWLYEHDVQNVSKILVIEALERIVVCCKMQGIQDRIFVPALVLRKLPDFLTNTLQSGLLTSQSALQSSLLHLILAFTKTMASEWRFVMCRFGEETFDFMLGMWENVSSPRQSALLEYLNIQLLIHHPQKDGVFFENSCYVNDVMLWQRCLHRLYQLIHDHLYQMSVKMKLVAASSSSEDMHTIPHLLVMLTARLCHKLFQDTAEFGYLNVTQIGTQITSTQGPKSSKRRKIEIGLDPIVSMLREEGTMAHCIPWYQILNELLTTYKLFFNQEKCSLLLDVFINVLAKCTVVPVQRHVIRCLVVLAYQYDQVFAEDKSNEELRIGKWLPVWDMTLRLISGKQCSKDGLKLMEALMHVSLVRPNASAYRLFYLGHVTFNQDALSALKALLMKVPLPRSFKMESTFGYGSDVKDARESLLQVLLPLQPEGHLAALESPSLLGQVLLSLRQRDTRFSQGELESTLYSEPAIVSSHDQYSIQELEDALLFSSFSCDILLKHCTENRKSRKKSSKEIKLLQSEERKLFDMVLLVVKKVMESGSKEIIDDGTINMSLQVLELLLILGLHISNSMLKDCLQDVMKLIFEEVQKLYHQTEIRWDVLLCVFKKLYYLYFQVLNWNTLCKEGKMDGNGASLAESLVCSTPDGLKKIVADMVKVRRNQTLNAHNLSTSLHESSMRRDHHSSRSSSPDFDDDFDMDSTTDVDMEMENMEEIDMEGPVTNLTKGNVKMGDTNGYCHQDQCLVMALYWMTLVFTPSLAGDSEMSSTLVNAISWIIDMTKSANLELINVAICLHMSRALFICEYDALNIDDGLKILSYIGRKYSQEPRVASFMIDVLKDLVSVNGSAATEEIQCNIMQLTTAVIQCQFKSNYHQCMQEAVFSLNTELVKLDPSRAWSNYTILEHERCGELYSILSNPSNDLRMMGTKFIYLLFQSNDDVLPDSGQQDMMFQSVYQATLEALTIQGLSSDEMEPDERHTRVTTLLMTLAIIAVNSKYLEAKSLFALCLAIPEQDIEAVHVSKVIARIAAESKMSLRSYMRRHLPYVISQWLRHNQKIETFPPILLEHQDFESCLKDHMDLMFPVLFESDKLDSLNILSNISGQDITDLVKQNFPCLIAHIFPYIAAEKSSLQNLIEDGKIQNAKKRYKYLEKAIGKQDFNMRLQRHVGDIVLKTLMSVYELDIDGKELYGTPNPPYFSLIIVEKTLIFIGELFENSNLASVLYSKCQELYTVVFGVLELIAKSTEVHDAHTSLTACLAFVNVVLPYRRTFEDSNKTLEDSAPFTILLLVHALTYYITHLCDLAPHLGDYNNKILLKVCECTVEQYPHSFAMVLPILVSRLLPFTRNDSKIQTSSLKILDFIMRDHPEEVKMLVARLPSLPDDNDYSSLAPLRSRHQQLIAAHSENLSLFSKVEHFVNHSSWDADPYTLTCLWKEISNSRNEIKELYKRLKPNEDSLGHQLTYQLLHLVSAEDQKISFEASKCLGELGPASLGTNVFCIKDKKLTMTKLPDNHDRNVITQMIKILSGYLTSENIDVSKASSLALFKILSMEDGYISSQELDASTLKLLYPFIPRHKPKGSSEKPGLDAAAYDQIVRDSEIWFTHKCFEDWVRDLTSLIIEAGCGSEMISAVLPLCKIKSEFCVYILAPAVHMALRSDKINRRDVISKQISLFFQKHITMLSESNISKKKAASICLDKSALQVLLKVIDYLRAQMPSKSFSSGRKFTPWEQNLWLVIDYLEAAQVAYYCGAFLSALLYLELHCEMLLSDENQQKDLCNWQLSRLQRISFHKDYSTMHLLMLKIYSAIGDSDGVEGCGGGSKLFEHSAQAICHKHRGQWMKALEVHDASNSMFGMVDILKELRLFNTLDALLNGASLKPSLDLRETHWESAWRLSQWDLANIDEKWEQVGVSDYKKDNFHQNLFCAFQSLYHQDSLNFQEHLTQARLNVIDNLKLQSEAESSSTIYPLLSNLQILSELENASNVMNDNFSRDTNAKSIENLENLWKSKDEASDICYTYMEPIIAARISTLRSLSSTSVKENVTDILHSVLLKKSALARQFSVNAIGCEVALGSALNLNVPQYLKWKMRLEEAEIARHRQDTQHATRVLSFLVEEMQRDPLMKEQEPLFCQVLHLYGCVLMDSRVQSPQTILNDYLNRAANILEKREDPASQKVLKKIYHKLAVYGDKLYKDVRQYLESDTIQSKREHIKRSEDEYNRIQNLVRKSTDETESKELQRKCCVLRKNITIDQNVINDLKKEQEEYLYLALQNYLQCLLISHDHDLHIYRAIALWLENSEKLSVNTMMRNYSSRIKSHKFVPLLYQLSARLTCQTQEKQGFAKVLLDILECVCIEHPHHCLPVVIALAHAHADDEFLKSSQGSGSRKKVKQIPVVEEDRVQAAKYLLTHLKKKKISSHVSEVERVCLAYLSLSNWSDRKERHSPGDKVHIPTSQPLFKLQDIQYTSALTRPLALQPSCQYDPPIISSFENSYTFVGGINSPKRLTMNTSDGLSQFELLKGKDDIRQDAVMEQVFGIVNELLARNPSTNERSLSVRTYQVVPLSQKSGLIQWCHNTQPFSEYLIGKDKKSGAHKMYHPKDYTATACRMKLFHVKSQPSEEKYKVFEDILNNFHPVFRHFFLENFTSPHEWYKRRQAYTKSVATNSMVGYILGLGDRHIENILLDKSTAELIHIDLGIAFDFGKVLPTPETVPFRLTRDVVDGLGVLGLEGPLRQCCESTLGVLRNAAEVLVTVVEVVRHDPLYQWTLSPQQVARLQADGEEEEDGLDVHSASMAERVVLRLQQKLAGFEDGFARSVSEQVTVLIQQATNNHNLARLFCGWQPYV